MPHAMPSHSRPVGTYAAIALFVVVYLGVLAFVLAPKDMIAAQSPTALAETD
jgi:hypothetical protein